MGAILIIILVFLFFMFLLWQQANKANYLLQEQVNLSRDIKTLLEKQAPAMRVIDNRE